MKLNKIFINLLCVPAIVSGAASSADGAQYKQRSVRSLKESALAALFSEAEGSKRAKALSSVLESGVYVANHEAALSVIYIMWLNANPSAPIALVQTIKEACGRMGIDATIFDKEDRARVVDISEQFVPNGPIKELKERPGTIAHFVERKPNSFSYEAKGLSVCDVWSIPNFREITYLCLKGNDIKDIAPGTFAGLSSLEELFLHCNQIAAIAPGTFAGLSTLKKLHLDENQIAAIASGTFAGLSALQELSFDSNYITAIASGAFEVLSALQELSLYNNDITAIAPGAFVGLSALRKLHLDSNYITAIVPGTFTGLSALKELSFDSNYITAIASGAFAGLSDLQKFHLSVNQIAAIASGAFAGLSALKILHLHKNQIAAIAPGTFAGLSVLEELELRGNDALQIKKPYSFQATKAEHPEWFTVQDTNHVH